MADGSAQPRERLLSRATDSDEESMTTIIRYDTSDLAAVLHGVLEKNKVHDSVCVVIII